MNDAKISVNVENSNSAELTLNGELTISSIEKIMPELNSIVDKFQNIKLKVENIDEIDLPGIQLFYSLKKTMKISDKNIKFQFDLSKDLIQKIKVSGFGNLLEV